MITHCCVLLGQIVRAISSRYYRGEKKRKEILIFPGQLLYQLEDGCNGGFLLLSY